MTLLFLELMYFRIADKCNIIDKPNERSSHSSIVLRGGGIIFLIGMWVWSAFFGFQYPWFLAAVTLAAGISFVDDIRSLPDSVRLLVQFTSMGLMFHQLDILHLNMWWVVILALIVCVGATNVINFMDGINGITAGYSLSVLAPLFLVSRSKFDFVEPAHALHNSSELGSALAQSQLSGAGFIDESFLVVAIIGVLVFCIFNFRPKGKAKCFAGDVGSIGIAFIMLFAIGKLIVQTGDVTYLIFLLVYGVDGCLTICHRIMLHENLGEAHRKHVFQLMANELKIGHVKVTLIYMAMQLVVSLGFIYLCPNTVFAHWMYMLGSLLVLSVAYILFKKKYYHLHEAYLASLG